MSMAYLIDLKYQLCQQGLSRTFLRIFSTSQTKRYCETDLITITGKALVAASRIASISSNKPKLFRSSYTQVSTNFLALGSRIPR